MEAASTTTQKIKKYLPIVSLQVRYYLYYLAVTTWFRYIVAYKSKIEAQSMYNKGQILEFFFFDKFGDIFRFSIGYACEIMNSRDIKSFLTKNSITSIEQMEQEHKDEIHAILSKSLFKAICICSLFTLISTFIIIVIRRYYNISTTTCVFLVFNLLNKSIQILSTIIRNTLDTCSKRPIGTISTLLQINIAFGLTVIAAFLLHIPITTLTIVIINAVSTIAALFTNLISVKYTFNRYISINSKINIKRTIVGLLQLMPATTCNLIIANTFAESMSVLQPIDEKNKVQVITSYNIYRNISGTFETPMNSAMRITIAKIPERTHAIYSSYISTSITTIFTCLALVIFIRAGLYEKVFFLTRKITRDEYVIYLMACPLMTALKPIEYLEAVLNRSIFLTPVTILINTCHVITFYILGKTNIQSIPIRIGISIILRHLIASVISLIDAITVNKIQPNNQVNIMDNIKCMTLIALPTVILTFLITKLL